MNNSEALIKLENIRKVFLTDEVETHALSGIHLAIAKGEYVSIAGPSGCGKSTLLAILGLLDTPSDGSYTLNGAAVASLDHAQRARIRNREIGFIFQSFNLIPDLNVFDNVDVPLRYRGAPAADRTAWIERWLEWVGLASRMKHMPAQLSGGQQQRVAVARALAGSPRLILADEPTGNLDTATAREIMELLTKVNEAGTTIIMVTHDPGCAAYAHRQIHILDGRLIDLREEKLPQFGASQLGIRSAAV
jgi:putative ABC transport system ATP-binding protein